MLEYDYGRVPITELWNDTLHLDEPWLLSLLEGLTELWEGTIYWNFDFGLLLFCMRVHAKMIYWNQIYFLFIHISH